jgi:hypothetical protein
MSWFSLVKDMEHTPNTPWPESASDRRLSAKFVPTFADTGFRVVSMTDRYGRILGFLGRSRYFFSQVAVQLYSRGWVAHYFSENLVAPGIEL